VFGVLAGNLGSSIVPSRVWVEISRSALVSNVQSLKQSVAPLGLMAVLKADAYGLGVTRIAEVIAPEGIAAFGVAELGAAFELTRFGLPIQLMGAVLPEEVEQAVARGIIIPISDYQAALVVSTVAKRLNLTAKVQLKLDTGMGRLGLWYEEALREFESYFALPNLDWVGLYSHFASAYTDTQFSLLQEQRYREVLDKALPWLHALGCKPEFIHIANSDGIQNIAPSYEAPYTLARSGINLYGFYDSEGAQRVPLREAVSLKSKLIAVKHLPPGSSIGYGRTFVTKDARRVGVVAIGYADGMPIQASNRGYVVIRGKRCGVLGRVSMDYTSVDLSDLPAAAVGDEVLCFGAYPSLAELASLKQTITYEVLCSLGNRVERRLVD
jgi:alanine racemase